MNAAGCGSTLKEYGHLLHDDPHWYQRGVAFSNRVKDIHEFLATIDLNQAALGSLPLTVTFQEPCHLAHAQRIATQPRMLLTAIPDLQLREMQEARYAVVVQVCTTLPSRRWRPNWDHAKSTTPWQRVRR